jgi:hypothetical protein
VRRGVTSAQTERQDNAGLVKSSLGGEDPTDRVFDLRDQSSFRIVPMPRFVVNGELLLLPNS